MVYFDQINISEGFDVNKTSASKKCDVCHYWYFLNNSFKVQVNACNASHDLLMMSMNISDIVILNIKGSDYYCIISLISKNEAMILMQNVDLTKKWNNMKHKNLLSNIKLGKEILTFAYIEIEKKFFYRNKIFAHLRDVSIEKV